MKTKIIILALVLMMIAGAEAVCNDCVLQITPVANNICQGDSAVYDVKITNVYDQAKAISIYAAGDIPLTSDVPAQITVDAYQTQTIRVTFTPTRAIIGQHRISFRVSGFGAEDSDDAVFAINDCYSADLRLQQSVVDLCEDDVGRVDFTLANNGQKQDTYTLSVGNIPNSLKASIAGGQISLAPGASRTGSITINAKGSDYGEYELQLSAQSQLKTVSQKFRINLKNCYHASVTAPEKFITCPDAGLTYTVAIKNDGCVADNYALTLSGTCKAKLGTNSLLVESGETKEVAVTLDPVYGDCNLTVAAASKYDSDLDSTKVTIKPCYGVDLQILPQNEVSACHGQPVDYKLKVTNIGYYADEYDLSLQGIPINLSKDIMKLTSGASDLADFTMIGTWCVTKDVIFIAKAEGQASDSERGMLKFLPAGEACAALEMSPSQSPMQIDCGGGAYTFYVKNTGYTNQEVTLSVLGPEDYLIQPGKVTLRPYESKPVAVYITPSAEGKFGVTVVATNEYKKAYLELNADFGGDICMISRPALEIPVGAELPIISEPEKAPNETVSYLSESPTGFAFGGTPMLIAVGLTLTALVLLAVVLLSGRKKTGGSLFPEAGGKQAVAGTDFERLNAIKEAIGKSEK